MTTEYDLRLDRGVCDGIFACLVRDDRFVEADDGLATVAGEGEAAVQTVRFDDDRVENARQAARACPLDAISVEVASNE